MLHDPEAQAAIMNQYAAEDAAILNDMINMRIPII